MPSDPQALWSKTLIGLETLQAAVEARSPGAPLDEVIRCPSDCGRCCSFPNIDVSIAECLPTAIAVLAGPSPQATAARIQDFALRGPEKLPCPLFLKINKTDGRCTYYRHRPILCRIYGNTTRPAASLKVTSNKYMPDLVGCDLLKDSLKTYTNTHGDSPQLQKIREELLGLAEFESILAEIAAINPQLGTVRMPIAKALHGAMQLVT